MTWVDTTPSIRKVPIIGDDIYQVGQVFKILDQPCTTNPTLAVQAAWSYAPTLIWTLLKPTPFDNAANRLARRHKTRRYRKLHIHHLQQLIPDSNNKVYTAFFNLGFAIERVRWYLLIADATTDFALNWTSMAYQWNGCTVPNSTWAQNGGNMPFAVEPFVPMPYEPVVAWSDSGGFGIASKLSVELTKTGPYSLTYSAQPEILPYLGQTGHISEFYLSVQEGGGSPFRIDLEKRTLENGKDIYETVYQVLDASEKSVHVAPLISWTNGRMQVLNQTLTLQGGNVGGLTFDP